MNRRETADLKTRFKVEGKHAGLPVAGYQPQDATRVALVNVNKEAEERVMRILDELSDRSLLADPPIDERWLREGRLLIEQGFMAVNRAIFQPGRIKLSEDDRLTIRFAGKPPYSRDRLAGQTWRDVVEQAAAALKDGVLAAKVEVQHWYIKSLDDDVSLDDEIPEHRGARVLEVVFASDETWP
ncbi:hypothetical protein [Bosea sp. (in: a-proteobacteria)]|uniref:Acb2/Tad1 domain-containing protein n=1 Tax=Bosea sp. (in: a-proteobacteria) TaxID=1871050 RepID=UPI0027374173|nr:hypothetical protein [Bosea sp. (in: a-proteobacteria)]MDP3408089.1 hypothetical protein [Bosea sp. (in: a-proteobacteria)]